jgi:hypothetical protein
MIGSASPTIVTREQADRARIRRHLANVEMQLRSRDVSNLPAGLQQARAKNIEALHVYAARGEFPRNPDFLGERRPYFIDHAGTACAVGHLMIESGAALVAEEIRRRENNALVADITARATLDWAARSGLTVEELALIQPTYCGCEDEYAPVCGVDGTTYANACVATMCGDVEIAHEGVCEAATGSPWPEPTTSDTTETSGNAGSSSDTTTHASTGATATEGDATAEASEGASTSGNASGDTSSTDAATTTAEPKSCNVAPPGHGAMALLWLVLLRRRRICER